MLDSVCRRVRYRVAALLLCYGASATTLGIEPARTSTNAGQTPEIATTATPEARLNSALAALDGIARSIMERSGVPGMAIAVVHADAVVYAKGFGVRHIGREATVDENTVFQLASLSKPIGATVVAGIIGLGKIDWDTPVSRLMPSFSLKDSYVSREVTIGDLYCHRSGLPSHAGDTLEDLGFSREQILHRLRWVPLNPFLMRYAYTNFGLTAAAMAVAKSTGLSWEDLSARILYQPLGMNSTSSRYDDYRNRANKSALHVRIDNHWEARHERIADAQSPAGGVSSSVMDMAKWMRLQLADGMFNGRKIIAAKPLIQSRYPLMLAKPAETSQGRAGFYGYGMGVGVDGTGRVRFSHSGAFLLGAATHFSLLPAENLGIVVLTNGMPVGAPEAVAQTFLDLVELGGIQRDWLKVIGADMAQLYENPSRLAGLQPPESPRPARRLAFYTGDYKNRYHDPARVFAEKGQIWLRLEPANQRFPLRHWSGDTFAYFPTGENAVGISAVDFKPGPGGKAGELIIEFLNQNGLGGFSR